jgi:tetratricopeptide (TPR) repeat protein
MPENISRGSPQEERALDAFRRRFRNDPIVVYDARSFRRTFIEMFLQRHLAALNDFRTTDENMLVWITKNETAITPSFFAAGWLASVGAVFVLSRPPEQAPRNLFLPHEETTDAERHVVQQHTVHTEVAVGVGRILAALLVRWAVRCMEAHSFETFRAIAPRLVPKIVMAGTIADQLVERIGEMVAGFEIGTPGATAGRYVFEAVLALLFAANGLDNPRRKNWTDILVRYEFERRLDGNDEALLLDPELLRSSIDQDEFLKEIRGFGAGLGRLDDKSEQIHHHLFDTIERIFPEEVNQLVRPELVLDESLSDAQALEISISLFHKAIAEPHSDTIDAAISALLRGLRRRPPIVEPAIRAMWSAKTDSPGTKHRIEFARRAIETLNLSHHFASALDIATEAEQLLPDAKDLSPFEVSTFLNEVGNCLRYAGAFQAALQRYAAAEAALGDASKQNKRVVMRNRAIVLRSMQRYTEAREIFTRLRNETREIERLANVISEAACLIAMGEERQALAVIDENVEFAEGYSMSIPEVREFTSLRAQLLLKDRPEEADRLATLLLEASGNFSDPALAIVAAHVKGAAIGSGRTDAEEKSRMEESIAALRQALERAREAKGLPDMVIGLTEILNITLSKLGRGEEAEQVVRDALEWVDPEVAPRGWLLRVHALRHAARRRDSAAVVEDALAALVWIDQSLATAAATSDAIALLAPYTDEIAELIEIVIEVGVKSNAEMQQVARTAADLLAAPVLTARVRGRVGLTSPTRDPGAEYDRFGKLCGETPVVIIQAVKLPRKIGLLTTFPLDGERLQSHLHILEFDLEEVDAILRRLDFHLRHAPSTVRSLNLGHVRGWPELAEALNAIVDDIPSKLPFCIVSGPLSTLPFSLVFGSTRPVCFAPSLGSILALRERRRRIPGGLAWRPRCAFEFAVSRVGDKTNVAQALQSAVSQGEAVARKYGLAFDAKIGVEADGPALLEGLSRADLTRIACHGRILPNEDAVDLLVAAHGLLPPAAAAALESSQGEGHVLGWRQLADLPRASPVVISSACDSGAAVLHAGGERLGLERPLFAAGSIGFVAPQWPVPASSIQGLMLTIFDAYMAEPSRPLAAVLMDSRNHAIAAGL